MESQSAKQILATWVTKVKGYCTPVVSYDDAVRSVELAEKEIKEKAIKAHWKCCHNLSKDNDQMCKHQTDCDRKCLYMTEFVNQL
ncbi:hypothetical protein DXD68_04195 [Parabacteroides sp. TM07-1AC]|uniref:hypothetical protein n=1 Tax=Parabacteroides sp. TM07-1AC TaxID=2292363 RepID=UPI000EFF78A6|nr:hypothetical protein [Parabacteroides sp. TM07-1AC]RHU31000.1 hypothetical protein DXD68_04195 [Parabacteroides sp. TM07-1AC]